MAFLPDNYKTPEGNFMKFKQGDNCFRVLDSAITGYEYWNNEKRPIRSPSSFGAVPPDIRVEDDGKISIKHFWMFPVWNYDAEKIQILEITQKGVQDAIKVLIKNPKWGDPTGFDLTISKEGSGFDTTYQVMPSPHSKLDAEVVKSYKAMKLNLPAVFTGDDPFNSLPQPTKKDEKPF